MDNARFDRLTKSLAERSSRRALLKGFGGAIAGAIGLTARDALAAPAIGLSQTSGPVRTRVTVSLSGFKRFEPFDVRWFDGSAFKVLVANTATRSGIRTVAFTVPNATRGTHVVRAVGSMGSGANATYRIVQSITMPEKVTLGASAKATLRGFKANVVVQLRFFATASHTSTNVVLGSTTVSATGTGTITFNVPDDAALEGHRVEGRETASGVLARTVMMVECGNADNCPGDDSECKQRTCISGNCGWKFAAVDVPLTNQTAGDCKKNVCDGKGGETTIPDDGDLPDDGNQCTVDSCSAGEIVQSSTVSGTACFQNGGTVCDGAGSCVECVSAEQCGDGACQSGNCVDLFCTPDRCDDGIHCTVDSCDEANQSCSNVPDDSLCDDGSECTANVCNHSAGCVTTPLPAGTPCAQGGGDACDGAGNCISSSLCTPFNIRPCYTGPPGTLNIGMCQAGTESCDADGSAWGACLGEVTPATEVCNGFDDDCDGAIDDGEICPPAPHAAVACLGGACVIASCDAGYRNCDGQYATGCETAVQSNANHCGGCEISCSPFEVCLNAICQAPGV